MELSVASRPQDEGAGNKAQQLVDRAHRGLTQARPPSRRPGPRVSSGDTWGSAQAPGDHLSAPPGSAAGCRHPHGQSGAVAFRWLGPREGRVARVRAPVRRPPVRFRERPWCAAPVAPPRKGLGLAHWRSGRFAAPVAPVVCQLLFANLRQFSAKAESPRLCDIHPHHRQSGSGLGGGPVVERLDVLPPGDPMWEACADVGNRNRSDHWVCAGPPACAHGFRIDDAKRQEQRQESGAICSDIPSVARLLGLPLPSACPGCRSIRRDRAHGAGCRSLAHGRARQGPDLADCLGPGVHISFTKDWRPDEVRALCAGIRFRVGSFFSQRARGALRGRSGLAARRPRAPRPRT